MEPVEKYFLQDKEVGALHQFLARHEKCRLHIYRPIPTNIILEFTQTGIGVATTVTCRCCNVEENITDYSTW